MIRKIPIRIHKVAFLFIGIATLCFSGNADKLVLLHTNDIHSAIEPLADGTSGMLQRKAIIDSVRGNEKNVVLIDAGDAVQGTLFFKYFGGDVEYPMMDMCGYDIRILGNHEFDNGLEELAKRYKNIKGACLSANYDFSGTELEGIFMPYIIKEFKNKKVGFIGINLDPEGIIATKNITFKYNEIIPMANELAACLKEKQGCDLVVAVTHIGYEKINEKTSDVELARSSHDIDIIIGGHTHTVIDPANPDIFPSLVKNAKGKHVRIAQTGKQGRYIGKIEIDLDNLEDSDGACYKYELIPVTDRFPHEQLDKEMIAFLDPYRQKVDSIDHKVVGKAAYTLERVRLGGLANLTADFSLQYTNHVADSLRKNNLSFPRVDMSILNGGGIRHEMPEGNIYEGQILSTYPFSNRPVIIRVKGKDLIEALRVSAAKGGEPISGNVMVVTDNDRNLRHVIIDGDEMDPESYYVVGTIDYVAEGNDGLKSLANHQLLWKGEEEFCVPILQWFKRQSGFGIPVNPDPRSRFIVESY